MAWRSPASSRRARTSASRPGRRLEHLGAQRPQGPQQLAVLDQLGLAPQAALDVAARAAAVERRAAVGRRSAEDVGELVTPHGSLLLGRRAASRQREQAVAQLAAGPVQAHLGRRLRDAQLGGDGLVGQVVDVAEHDDGPQPGRQAGEGLAAAGRGASAASARASGSSSGRLVDRRASSVSSSWRCRAPPAEVGGRAVGRDPVQPRRELGVAAEALEAPVGPEVGLLHHVARVLLVPGEPVGQGVGVGVGAPAPARRTPLGRRPWRRATSSATSSIAASTSIGPVGMRRRSGYAGRPRSGRAAVTATARSAGLLVERVGAVPAAVLLHLDALAVVDLVLRGDVVAALARRCTPG